jgi:hypothetical protein
MGRGRQKRRQQRKGRGDRIEDERREAERLNPPAQPSAADVRARYEGKLFQSRSFAWRIGTIGPALRAGNPAELNEQFAKWLAGQTKKEIPN